MKDNNPFNMLGKIQQIQKDILKVKQELKDKEVVGSSGGGMVKVTMNGDFEVSDLIIEDEILNDDKQMLKDLIAAALNDAISKAKQMIEENIKEVTGGLNIPGLF